jgi:hypothetical protein
MEAVVASAEVAVVWWFSGVYQPDYSVRHKLPSLTHSHSAPALTGPWTRQGHDINCHTDSVEVCGTYGAVVTPQTPIIAAQGIGLSLIPTTNGTVYLWSGERWLSAPNNNPEVHYH